MKTVHHVFFSDSGRMPSVASESVDLIVTSPPYPMIAMWDELFSKKSPVVKNALSQGRGTDAFRGMHEILDKTWAEVWRVLKEGGIACINIGDATRTVRDNFSLYPNHSRILQTMLDLGFSALPCVLWRKQTNAPNKFMGSGMLPAGAYVTLEHEYILIFRKGEKRTFKKTEEKENRRQSALFWEERNLWYSDVWFDVKGILQTIDDREIRMRSAAYPFEVAYRLINMYAAKGDTVLDPFLGTGTTMAAAMASGRNSIGFEINSQLKSTIHGIKEGIADMSRHVIRQRLLRHVEFVAQRLKTKGGIKHHNVYYGFPVVTAQERELLFNDPSTVQEIDENVLEVIYKDDPQGEFCKDWAAVLKTDRINTVAENMRHALSGKNCRQKPLF